MLEVRNLKVFMKRVSILDDISFHIDPEEIIAVIGSNGAGKTTLLRALSGLTTIRSGEIKLQGENIHNLPPHRIVERGMSQIPERGRVFPHMTVLEHLQLGAWTQRRSLNLKKELQSIYKLFPVLENRINQLAGTMSGGERQLIAIARALMSKPRILLLDEPTLGVAPIMRQYIGEIIQGLNKKGMTVLIVEQDALLALSISNRGYVLETGRVVLSGISSASR